MNNLFEIIKNNQLLTTAIGLSSAGIITFWVKDFPKQLYKFIKKQVTTELIMTSQNTSFSDAMKWIENNYKDKNFRNLKLSNGRWGYNSETITSIGYGVHFIKYNKIPLIINLNKESANNTEYDKETLTITKLGRSRKVFDDFIKEIKIINENKNKTKVYKMVEQWEFVKDQVKRNLNTVFLEKSKKEKIIKTITKFKNNEKWYVKNGIPYQLGILLYGSAGTGKTSMIKAISGFLDYPIYYLSPAKLCKIESAMSTLPDKCIVVIEDIDSNTVTHERETNISERDKNDSEADSLIKGFELISLSEILNSLDGIFSAHGRILITTTNHREHLDSALIRAGRIDLEVEIGFVNIEILECFLNNFYSNEYFSIKNEKVKNNITVATLQNMVLNDKTLEEILNFCLI